MRFYCCLFALLSWPLLAEYRLYQYYVSSPTTQKVRHPTVLVTSALDPVSYAAFHGGPSQMEINLLRTWICPGYTGTRPYCPSPYQKALEKRPKININRE